MSDRPPQFHPRARPLALNRSSVEEDRKELRNLINRKHEIDALLKAQGKIILQHQKTFQELKAEARMNGVVRVADIAVAEMVRAIDGNSPNDAMMTIDIHADYHAKQADVARRKNSNNHQLASAQSVYDDSKQKSDSLGREQAMALTQIENAIFVRTAINQTRQTLAQVKRNLMQEKEFTQNQIHIRSNAVALHDWSNQTIIE
jgi:hypothetical protein